MKDTNKRLNRIKRRTHKTVSYIIDMYNDVIIVTYGNVEKHLPVNVKSSQSMRVGGNGIISCCPYCMAINEEIGNNDVEIDNIEHYHFCGKCDAIYIVK
jgi:hypothetical protein